MPCSQELSLVLFCWFPAELNSGWMLDCSGVSGSSLCCNLYACFISGWEGGGGGGCRQFVSFVQDVYKVCVPCFVLSHVVKKIERLPLYSGLYCTDSACLLSLTPKTNQGLILIKKKKKLCQVMCMMFVVDFRQYDWTQLQQMETIRITILI